MESSAKGVTGGREQANGAYRGHLLRQTVELRKGVTEEALHRLRSYKKLTDQPTTEWMQFRLEVSLRPLGDPVWNTLQNWVGQGAWHLLGCRLRRERPQYNGLMDQVRQGLSWLVRASAQT